MNKIKNLLIIFFIICTVIQTNILWLQNISHHNFFYKIKERQTPAYNYIAENFKLEIKNDKNLFAIIYKPDEKTKKIPDSALKEIFKKGKFISKTNFDFDNEIEKSICIYDYDFFISIENFSQYLGLKSNTISKLKSFNKIFFETGNTIAFADTLENKLYRYKTENNFDFKQLVNSQNDYIYDKNLLPIKNLYLPNVKTNNPYEENGDLLMDTIENKLSCFFDNSVNKNIENVNNILVFSVDSNVVKYYPNNILEYISYQTGNKNSDLITDYTTAINFIKKDECITNNIILKKYCQTDSQTEFYFDYIINNMPIEIEKNLSKNIQLENFLTVTVKNGIVTKYKKLAFNFINTTNHLSAKIQKYIYNGQNDLLTQF